MKIRFEIPGPIVPKQRPRQGRYGHFYTPAETVDFEDKVGWYALAAGLRGMKNEIKVTLVCEITPRKDLDNIIKSILDGLKMFFNDTKVTEIHAFKAAVSKKEERAVVTIEGGI